MKHLEPEPHAAATEIRSSAYSRPSRIKLFLIGALLVAGIGYGLTNAWNAGYTDQVSEARKAELVAEFAKLKAVEVVRVDKEDLGPALDSMRLPPDQRRELETKLSAQGQPELTASDGSALVWLNVWDFASADGDVVHISSAGYEIDVTLQKLQTRIAVPLDATGVVNITGVHDGGGGITLAVQSGAAPISMPVLRPGQMLALPVTY